MSGADPSTPMRAGDAPCRHALRSASPSPCSWARAGSPGASPAPGSLPASPIASATTFASPRSALAGGPECDAGQIVRGDIDRPAGARRSVQGLLADFKGVLATDQLVLGSYQGRPAVIVTRDQQVIFIASYGQDGRTYQYVGCAAAIEVVGT